MPETTRLVSLLSSLKILSRPKSWARCGSAWSLSARLWRMVRALQSGEELPNSGESLALVSENWLGGLEYRSLTS